MPLKYFIKKERSPEIKNNNKIYPNIGKYLI